MEAIGFKESNVEVAKDQKEYKTLPSFRAKDEQGTMVSCYRLSFLERAKVVLRGKIWMSEMTFNKPVTPRIFSVNKWDFLNKEYFKNK